MPDKPTKIDGGDNDNFLLKALNSLFQFITSDKLDNLLENIDPDTLNLSSEVGGGVRSDERCDTVDTQNEAQESRCF